MTRSLFLPYVLRLMIGVALGILSGLGPVGAEEAKSPGNGTETSTKTGSQPGTAIPGTSTAVRQGIRAELSVLPVPTGDETPTAVREGEYATVTLRLTDAATGAPATAMVPRLWIDRQKEMAGDKKAPPSLTCNDKVRNYLQGTLSFRPDIDLNSYYILTLNNDASISVIDPILGVAGYSQLYTMIHLPRPGEDWVFDRDGKTLYVTMPKAGEVAVIDTDSFKVSRTIAVGGTPFRIALQPDGRYLWVGNDSTGADSGVTVIDTLRGTVAARIPTGAGHHEISFDDSSEYAAVSNRDAGTVTVIDIQRLARLSEIATGSRPVGIEYSPLAKSFYVAHEEDGSVAVISGTKPAVAARIRLEPGLRALRFAPGGRWGFAINSRASTLAVIDASNNEIAYRSEAGVEPDKISFTQEFAYVHSTRTAELTLFALANLGKGDKITSLKVPGGSLAPKESTIVLSVADSIVATPEGNAVLIASPADTTIIYYMEGMSVPMGSFRTYGRIPRAVSTVSRQMRETAPGVFTGRVKIPGSGRYDAVFLLDSPRVVQCFEFTAEPNPSLQKLKANHPVTIRYVSTDFRVNTGEESRLQFRVTDAATGDPVKDIADLLAVIVLQPTGSWKETVTCRHIGDGLYEAITTLPRPGTYRINFTIPSKQVKLHHLPGVMIHGEKAESPAPRQPAAASPGK